jgi:NDP-sugar pyrophosphorylase family protein
LQYGKKPSTGYGVSTGIYAFDRRSLRYIPDTSHRDFPDVVSILMEAGKKVCIHLFDTIWLDLGRAEGSLWVEDELTDLRTTIPFLQASYRGTTFLPPHDIPEGHLRIVLPWRNAYLTSL